MTDKEALMGNERVLLTRLIESDGWQLFKAKWAKIVKDCESKLLAQDCPNRDWLAGHLAGINKLFNYPETHIELCDEQLEKLSKSTR